MYALLLWDILCTNVDSAVSLYQTIIQKNITMQKDTILNIVHTESSCGWGGQEIRILDEAQGMMLAGHSLHILCSAKSKIYHEAMKRQIPTTALPIERKKLKGLFAIKKWLKNHSVDIVNTHSSTDSWLVSLARLLSKKNFSIVRTRHISAPIKATFATRWLYNKGCDFVVTTGERLCQYVIESTGLPENRVKSVPTGVDLERFKEGNKENSREHCGLPQSAYIIGILATLRSWKGHRYLLEAFSQLNLDNSLLLIVGDGPGWDNLKAQAKQLNIEDNVIMTGNQSDVVPWLQSMDLFVLPSYANEGVPQSLMQAMAVGLPVIGTAVGSVDELVKDNSTGLITKTQNTNALIKSIVQFQSQILAEQLSSAGQQHVQEYYSSDVMLANMLNIFHKVRKI